MKTPVNVLLVEDDDDDQFFFTEALSYIENTTLCGIAANGKEALERLRDPLHLPDIIFTDINMPVMDGMECLAEIMKNPRTKDIPVVILSSDSSKSMLACALGAKAFINKTAINSLRTQIEQMLNSQFSIANHGMYAVLA